MSVPANALPITQRRESITYTAAGWRAARVLVMAAGVVLWALLWFVPETGLLLFWNLLIPAAPALLVAAAGVWRNVCPLATVALLARSNGWSRRRKLSVAWQGRLQLLAVMLLLAIVPLRHVWFDTSGHGTAWLLACAGAAAFAAGWLFEWKSAWCNGLCPVQPVERLYGSRAAATFQNARCTTCAGCTAVCADSTPALSPHTGARPVAHALAAGLLVGGFPGFVAGWSLVPDSIGGPQHGDLARAYLFPFSGMAISLALYAALTWRAPHRDPAVRRVFAAAAVIIYYWFRLPALIGFGIHPQDGVLVDLSGRVPAIVSRLLQAGAAGFFFWWLLLRRAPARAWSTRPPRS